MTEMVDMERLARVWRKMEDKINELTDEFETEVGKIRDQQKLVSAALLSAMNELKADKLTTSAGIVEKKETVKVSGSDWNAIYRFVATNEAWEMLHKRLSSTFVEKHIKDFGSAPPGVNVFREFKVAVKKPSSKELPVEGSDK